MDLAPPDRRAPRPPTAMPLAPGGSDLAGRPVTWRAGVPGTVDIGADDRAGPAGVVVAARSRPGRHRGALGRADGEGLALAARQALSLRVPLVLHLASSGADVSEGIDALHGWGSAAQALAACSGQVPIVAVVTGPVISGPAFLLGLADLVVMTPKAVAFVSGPSMVEAFTGVRVGIDELGGVAAHARSSGLCTLVSDDPEAAVDEVLSYLPPHADAEPPFEPTDDPPDRPCPELRQTVPARDTSSYDVRDVARSLCDDATLLELWAQWAPQVVTAFARLHGRTVGVVANQPRVLAGTLDIAASQKAARFVRLCDAFNVALLTLVDTPGFLPGKDLEWRGMIRHGAELAFAYCEATVPRLCVILRKAFGGAYIVMDSRGIGNDLCLAWPGAEVAVMGAAGAVQILHRSTGGDERAEREQEYREAYLSPWPAAERGLVDAVIDPAETRQVLSAALAQLWTRREALPARKHDAGPL